MTVSLPANLDLSPAAWLEVKRILEACVPGCEVWAFGSRATGQAKPYSDLDLVIISDKPLSLATLADLTTAFDESSLTFKVDIVDWATARDSFREIIRKTALTIQKPSPNTAQ